MGGELLWTLLEALLILAFVVAIGLASAIIFETFSRRFNHKHVEAPPIFEDPNSLKQVPCPHIFDTPEKYLSLIVPAYNEENRLPAAVDETMNYLQQRAAKDKSFTYEVIIIDDGSADGTKRVAFDFVKRYTVDNVRVILLGRNHGKGEAIRKGILHSRGELVLMLDADGATKVDDLEKLETQIHAVARKDRKVGDSVSSDSSLRVADIPIAAFGSRAHLEEKALATRKWYRNFLMKGFHVVVVLAAGPGIRDTQCGFKMFTRAAARKLFTNIRLKRRQASYFLKDKIKVARLALTDVTPAQLLTEEITDEDSSAPDSRSMRVISRAAFEVEDYWRVVDILHKKLFKYDRRNWRASYNALILLEHLLTHGPARVAEEFQSDQEIIREMTNFHYVDEKGFNWGLRVQRKAERVLKLMEDKLFLKEERARSWKLTSGIKGFGSFCHRPVSTDGNLKLVATSEKYMRSNSHFSDYKSREEAALASDNESIQKAEDAYDEWRNLASEKAAQNHNSGTSTGDGYAIEEDHPFYDKENQDLVSLLSPQG